MYPLYLFVCISLWVLPEANVFIFVFVLHISGAINVFVYLFRHLL